MLITGVYTIPYVIVIYILWVRFNISWAQTRDEQELAQIGFVGGLIWAVFICIAGWNYDSTVRESNIIAYLCEYIPLILLILFGTKPLINYLSEKNMLDSLIYVIPVLLTLTLFFL